MSIVAIFLTYEKKELQTTLDNYIKEQVVDTESKNLMEIENPDVVQSFTARHMILEGRVIGTEFLRLLTQYATLLPRREISSDGGVSYLLLRPKPTWSHALRVNCASVAWSDTMDFYVVLRYNKNSNDAVLALSILGDIENAMIDRNDDYMILGFYASKAEFDGIDTTQLESLRTYRKLVPSYQLSEGVHVVDRSAPTHRIDWMVKLPNSSTVKDHQIATLASYSGHRNFIAKSDDENTVNVAGSSESYEKQHESREDLATKLGTECRILLFCQRCKAYVENVKFENYHGGSRFQCLNVRPTRGRREGKPCKCFCKGYDY